MPRNQAPWRRTFNEECERLFAAFMAKFPEGPATLGGSKRRGFLRPRLKKLPMCRRKRISPKALAKLEAALQAEVSHG